MRHRRNPTEGATRVVPADRGGLYELHVYDPRMTIRPWDGMGGGWVRIREGTKAECEYNARTTKVGKRLNPMVLSLKGRRVRVHALGNGIRFHQRAWPSEAAILAHSLKQAKHITKAYGETWTNPRRRRNPLPTRITVLTSKSTADYTISRVTDHRGETLFHVRFISGPHAGHTGNDYVLGDLLDWVGKMGYRVLRQGVRRERRKWRGLSKADRKRIHREETVEVRDHLRNPRRRRNPADEYEDPAWRAEAIQMVRDHIAFGRDGGVSRDSVWDNLQDTLQETRRLHWFDVVAHAFDKQWPADS